VVGGAVVIAMLVVGGGGLFAGLLLGRSDGGEAERSSSGAPVAPLAGNAGSAGVQTDKTELPAAAEADAGSAVVAAAPATDVAPRAPGKRPRRDPDPDPDPDPVARVVPRELLQADSGNVYTHGEIPPAAARLNAQVSRCFDPAWRPDGSGTASFVGVDIDGGGTVAGARVEQEPPRNRVPASTAACIERVIMRGLRLPAPDNGRGGTITLYIPLHAQPAR
jgi:hypothetical protein